MTRRFPMPRGAGLLLALLTSSSVHAAPVILPATSAPDAWNWRPFVLGFGVGGLVGAAAGGLGAGAATAAALRAASDASGCQAEECEGYGLMFYFGVPLVALSGAAVGGAAGAFGGGAIAMALTE